MPTISRKLGGEFAALAAEAGLEFVEISSLADDGLGRPELTWHYMDGLDTRLILRAAFSSQSLTVTLFGQAVTEPGPDWFKARRLVPVNAGSASGLRLDRTARYADGGQLRDLLGLLRDLLGPYAVTRDEPARPGESLASRKQAAEVIAGFGITPPAAARVVAAAYTCGHAAFGYGQPVRPGYVDYDREKGTYEVRTPAGKP